MNCAMCPSWMGGGMVLGAAIGAGAVRRTGSIVQLGLTPDETERLFERVQLLLSKVRIGEIEVF